MKVVYSQKIDMSEYGEKTDCDVYVAHVKIGDIDKRANEMIQTITDTCWIEPLGVIEKAAFQVTSARTIDKLVDNIKNRVTGDALTDDFGEYMVSDTALCTLAKLYTHNKVPLAELLKARLSGNEGFDFHSECGGKTISFGEAKYSGSGSPYNKALKQISRFIKLEKDVAELIILQVFVSKEAALNCTNGVKSYAAAFSINADKPELIIKNALESDHLKGLLRHKGLYLIGVEINDPEFD